MTSCMCVVNERIFLAVVGFFQSTAPGSVDEAPTGRNDKKEARNDEVRRFLDYDVQCENQITLSFNLRVVRRNRAPDNTVSYYTH